MTIVPINTHVEDAVSRLIYRFKEKPRAEGLIAALTGEFQTIEDALEVMLNERTLANAFGSQLDRIGDIVGRARGSYDDNFYRILLYVTIGQNTSQGDPAKIVNVFKLLTGASSVHFQNLRNAKVYLSGNAGLGGDRELVNFIYANMQRVVAGGVRIDGIVSVPQVKPFVFNNANPSRPGGGFGSLADSSLGGHFSSLKRQLIPFAFDGTSTANRGFGSLRDPLAGGVFRSVING